MNEKRKTEQTAAEESRSKKYASFKRGTIQYWKLFETAYDDALEFEAKQFPLIKQKLSKIGDFKLPWNEQLVMTQERHCCTDECDTANAYPVWALELLGCFTNGGAVNRVFQMTYEPISRFVFIHHDAHFYCKVDVTDDDWIEQLEDALKVIGEDIAELDARAAHRNRFKQLIRVNRQFLDADNDAFVIWTTSLLGQLIVWHSADVCQIFLEHLEQASLCMIVSFCPLLYLVFRIFCFNTLTARKIARGAWATLILALVSGVRYTIYPYESAPTRFLYEHCASVIMALLNRLVLYRKFRHVLQ